MRVDWPVLRVQIRRHLWRAARPASRVRALKIPTGGRHAPGQKQWWFGLELGWLVRTQWWLVRTQSIARLERDGLQYRPVRRQPVEQQRLQRYASYDAE